MLMSCVYHNKKVSRNRRGASRVLFETRWAQTGERLQQMLKKMRTTIAAKLSQGINMSSVMDYIRGSMCGPLNRDHLITHADLHNIKQQYDINCMQKASDDTDSVLYWVQEIQCEEFNPVLFFKPQGQKSDFNVWKKKISYWHCKRSSKKKCLKNMLRN